mmetsp:Transcript_8799/g.30109  ORF Transcript_8799/g.30109 Transcript_8799/m.30109 type:complete len:211 (+) Transcript_8799:4325-4957(+)
MSTGRNRDTTTTPSETSRLWCAPTPGGGASRPMNDSSARRCAAARWPRGLRSSAASCFGAATRGDSDRSVAARKASRSATSEFRSAAAANRTALPSGVVGSPPPSAWAPALDAAANASTDVSASRSRRASSRVHSPSPSHATASSTASVSPGDPSALGSSAAGSTTTKRAVWSPSKVSQRSKDPPEKTAYLYCTTSRDTTATGSTDVHTG